MKDSMGSTIVSRTSDSEVFANRKLIRPSLARTENHRPENGEEVLTEKRLSLMLSRSVSTANAAHRRPDQRTDGRV